ncbi:hypothetical protein E1283_13170 [Streptomyces hainanensis]|uniref:Uncharacterized protein n=1 Tax=Streptomyces hainanensis TaxID=402648 RepID=A0A4R4TD40_9ACTN|nr:hypothetical protein E1283_13170 [Streptomyces hainanensis]
MLLGFLIYFLRWPGIVLTLAVTWTMTAVLKPRSGSLTRGMGYAAVAGIPVCLAPVVIAAWEGVEGLTLSIALPFFAINLLTIAAYCYRDVKTRRAASSSST